MFFSSPKAHTVFPLFSPVIRKSQQYTPLRLQQKLIAKALNFTFAGPLAADEFDCLNGRQIGIDVTDLHYKVVISLNSEGRFTVNKDAEAETWIRGELLSFYRLIQQQEDPDTLFFQRRLLLEGDTELGLTIKNILDGLDWDELPHNVRRLLTLLGRVVPA